jgi:hypothetical protein
MTAMCSHTRADAFNGLTYCLTIAAGSELASNIRDFFGDLATTALSRPKRRLPALSSCEQAAASMPSIRNRSRGENG